MRKLVYFVTEDWYFVSHRIHLALAAQKEGFEIFLITRVDKQLPTLLSSGFHVIPFNVSRSSINPFTVLCESFRLAKIYRRIKPDIVHHISLRPIIIGAIACLMTGITKIVATVTGMGFLFVEGRQSSTVRRFLQWIFPKLLRRGLLIVQNEDDQRLLERCGIPSKQIRLILGSGVDTSAYLPTTPLSEDNVPPIVMFASRLLWDKGIKEFIEAAEQLRNKTARFVVVGPVDPSNPATISTQDLEKWIASETIEYWGHRSDMSTVLPKAAIVCLPSYREGLPKILIEAMSCGRPCITTDVPGCRQAVRDQDNGLLVPARNAKALSAAIAKLIDAPFLRQKMGERGRMRAIKEFDEQKIIKETIRLYTESPL